MNTSYRALAALGLSLIVTSAAWAAAPARGGKAPAKPATPVAAPPAPKQFIDGVRDTGQFLPDTFVVCRVGPRVTTVKDYVRLYFDSYAPDRPRPDSAGRVTFLENIITKDVLGQVALGVDRPLGFEDRVVLRETEQRTLSNALYRVAVMDSIRISDEDIAREYELFKFQLRLRHIRFANRATAVRVRSQLQQGLISWRQAYERYSTSREADRSPDGEIGWVARGNIDVALARKIFTLVPGSYSEPIEDPEGWDVIQVVERRADSPPMLASLSSLIRDQLMQESIAKRSRVVRDLVRDQIGMSYDSTNIAWTAAHFRPVRETSTGPDGVPRLEFNTEIPHFEPADTSRVLARHRDRVLTLGWFFELYHAIQPLFRPSVDTPAALREQIDGFAFEPYMAIVAAERGIGRDPMVLAEIARKREELLVQHLFGDSVESRVAISPEARRRFYRDNLKAFVTWSSVRFASLWAATQAEADSFAAALRAGESAEDIIAAHKLLGIDRGMVRTRSENERGDFHKLLFEEMRPGQVVVVGPDKENTFLVLQKIEAIPGRQLSYDEASGMIDESLVNMESERALKELVARLRPRFAIASRPDLVMRIRLVDPTL